MKNLANCSGVEFLKQTNKIRHFVQKWLKDTNVLEIRKRKPIVKVVSSDMSEEQVEAVKKENELAMKAQVERNISDMLDSCLETHAEETLELLGMMCFLEPGQDVKVTELLNAFAEMLGDEGVINFFTSLMKWGVTGILN